ncbi:hypothetical protein B0H66DRAFT_537391 [Apodospora peruviana]|uniref:Uncharacterized protein n=1 Tax=Apodospora peruviana TaxID=516989 RepID=A0AAE0HWN6_9PEZI|nr:hypothetical protein B0H66DRAFT_537391 [Apodospora peruviana]
MLFLVAGTSFIVPVVWLLLLLLTASPVAERIHPPWSGPGHYWSAPPATTTSTEPKAPSTSTIGDATAPNHHPRHNRNQHSRRNNEIGAMLVAHDLLDRLVVVKGSNSRAPIHLVVVGVDVVKATEAISYYESARWLLRRDVAMSCSSRRIPVTILIMSSTSFTSTNPSDTDNIEVNIQASGPYVPLMLEFTH